MNIQYVRFSQAVQAPGKGGGSNSVYRAGDKYDHNTTNAATLLGAIERKGDVLVLVDRYGRCRRVPFALVIDFELPDDELTTKERDMKNFTEETP